MRTSILLSAGLLLALAAPVPAAELRSDTGDQTALSVTIYNRDLALVRDRRRVELPAGRQDLALRGVSARMRPETALLKDLSGETQVLEQNFYYDLLTPSKLLEKYLGRQIGILRTNPATGEEKRETATVLSTQNGLVVRIGDRIETNPGGRYLFEDIPPDLRDQPTLVTRLEVPRGGARELELSYLTRGLGWKADYVARLDRDATRVDLAGWVTLHNESGTSYRNAQLQLVAGEVNQVRGPDLKMLRQTVTARPRAEAVSLEEESLLDYHLYTLPRPTDLLDRQSKQVALMDAAGVPARRRYLLRGQSFYYRQGYGAAQEKLPVSVWLEFDNLKESGLGLPLPAGVVRVYQADRRGALQFVGEDRIDHTPKGEKIELRLGTAFDITARRQQLEWKRQGATAPYKYAAASRHRIELRNASERPVEVTVEEPMPGDWKILEESLPHERVDTRTARWRVKVPAEGRAVLEYRVRTQW